MPTRVSGYFLTQGRVVNEVIEHVRGVLVRLGHSLFGFIPGQEVFDSLLVLFVKLLQASISSVIEIDVISLEIATLLIEFAAQVRIRRPDLDQV